MEQDKCEGICNEPRIKAVFLIAETEEHRKQIKESGFITTLTVEDAKKAIKIFPKE